jgi:hypothetical protein
MRSIEDGSDNISPKRKRERDWRHFPAGAATNATLGCKTSQRNLTYCLRM